MQSLRHSSLLIACAVTACGPKPIVSTAPADPFEQIEVAPLPVATAAGTNVLLLTVGSISVKDTLDRLAALTAGRTWLLAAANAALDTALRRDAREVNWQGLEEQRRIARRNPTLGMDPDRLATVYLLDPSIERIPDPLWSQIRQIAGMTNARYALAPSVVRFTGKPDSLVASFAIVLMDARSGDVLGRIRSRGRPQNTPERALAAAAGALIQQPGQ